MFICTNITMGNSLGYTRIGLVDPNNNSFLFQHCQLRNVPTSCFQILKESNQRITHDYCHNGEIPLDEIEDHEYKVNDVLLNEPSKNNRVLISKTNNLIPYFVENFLKYCKEVNETFVEPAV
jgi:hypothetical protein